jgi:hypothetical protein
MHATARPRAIAPILAALLATACAPNGDTGPEPYAGPAPLELYLQTFTRRVRRRDRAPRGRPAQPAAKLSRYSALRRPGPLLTVSS